MENKGIEIKPVITEKSYALANAQNKYTFLVSRGTSKVEVRKEVEKKYKVKVEKINVTVRPGKLVKNWKTRQAKRKEDMKKAVVQLKKGDKIDEFLNIK
jgi:large subunit ribosomal protein L23